MQKLINKMSLTFDAISQNEALARVVISAFVAQLDPVVSDMEDIKTAVSEAVTNSIVHGYEGEVGTVHMTANLYDDGVEIIVEDYGKGISDIQTALKPMYSSKASDDRAGLGFTVMEAFMDKLEVVSTINVGTTVCMLKRIEKNEETAPPEKKEINNFEGFNNLIEDYFENGE